MTHLLTLVIEKVRLSYLNFTQKILFFAGSITFFHAFDVLTALIF